MMNIGIIHPELIYKLNKFGNTTYNSFVKMSLRAVARK